MENILELSLPRAPFWKEVALLGAYFSACNKYAKDADFHLSIDPRFIDFFQKRADSVHAYMQDNVDVSQWQREKFLLQIGNLECLISENGLQTADSAEKLKYKEELRGHILSSLQNIEKAFSESFDPEKPGDVGRDVKNMFEILIGIASRNEIDIPWKQHLEEFGVFSPKDTPVWQEEQNWIDTIGRAILVVEAIARTSISTDTLERIQQSVASSTEGSELDCFSPEESELRELFNSPVFSDSEIYFIVDIFEKICGTLNAWEKEHVLFYLLEKRSEKQKLLTCLPVTTSLGKTPLAFFASNNVLKTAPTAVNLADFMNRAAYRGAFFALMDEIDYLPSVFDTILSDSMTSKDAEKLAEAVLLYSQVTRDATYLKYIPKIISHLSSRDRGHFELAYLSAGVVCREFSDLSR